MDYGNTRNNPACTKKCERPQAAEVGHCMEEEEEDDCCQVRVVNCQHKPAVSGHHGASVP